MKKKIMIEATVAIQGNKLGEKLQTAIMAAMFGSVELEFLPYEAGCEITGSRPAYLYDIKFTDEDGNFTRLPIHEIIKNEK